MPRDEYDLWKATVEPTPTLNGGEGTTNVFLQWKGTDVCLDFYCACGGEGHFDGYFAGALRCPGCGAVYAMPALIYPAKVESESRQPTIVDVVADD